MILQVAAILSVFTIAYLALQILGPRSVVRFISLADRESWATTLQSQVGKYFYITNIAATLTSLATVYVFFIGNSREFGYALYASLISIVLGSFVTVALTRRLLATKSFRENFASGDLSTVALTALFWQKDDPRSHLVSLIAKAVTVTSIVSLLWLEFATAVYIASGLFGLDSSHAKTILMFIFVFLVFDFTVRNGLRGFVFLDLFLAPIILVGTIILAVGVIILTLGNSSFEITLLARPPEKSGTEIFLFVVMTFFLNSFLLLTTESHWIRVWTMRSQVSTTTLTSMFVTALLWAILIVIGLFAVLSVKGPGIDAVVDLVRVVGNISPIYTVGFWIAAVAALLSTCDAQLYSLLLVWAFNSRTGKIEGMPSLISNPSLFAFGAAIIFSVIFYIVSERNFPLEPIVFFVFPVFICLLPSMVQLIKSDRLSLAPIILAVLAYGICGLGMLLIPDQKFAFAFAAPLMSAIVSALVLVGVVK
jgi:hypothetical protein